jgi:aminomethyltransferase
VRSIARRTSGDASLDGRSFFLARTGYTGEDGFEVMASVEDGSWLLEKLVTAGVTPLESGLAWTVDLAAERDFVGKAALLAQQPQRALAGLLLIDKGVLRAHQTVVTTYGPGEITSGSFAPSMGQSIALARLPKAVAVGDTVEVQVRDKRLKAKVVKPPFVRQGKILV